MSSIFLHTRLMDHSRDKQGPNPLILDEGKEISIFQVFKLVSLLGVWNLGLHAKFQPSIFKIMPARPQKTVTWV